MPWRPFLAASSRRPISGSVRKSLSRSWPSVVATPLFTFRPLVAISAYADIAYFLHNASIVKNIQVPQAPRHSRRLLAGEGGADQLAGPQFARTTFSTSTP